RLGSRLLRRRPCSRIRSRRRWLWNRGYRLPAQPHKQLLAPCRPEVEASEAEANDHRRQRPKTNVLRIGDRRAEEPAEPDIERNNASNSTGKHTCTQQPKDKAAP